MRKTILAISVLFVQLLLFIMVGCKDSTYRELKWSVYEITESGSEDVVLSVDEEEITDSSGEFSVHLKNNSDYELSFFIEDVKLLRMEGGEFFDWRDEVESDMASAEIEQVCMPHEEITIPVQMDQLLPSILRKSGDYMLYLPFSFMDESNEWERAYAHYDLSIVFS